MSTDISLTFINGGKQPRAAQIPRKAWETHKRAIQELYTHFTLAEMMEVMKTDYGFDATARQYTWKLCQWGLSKQSTGEEQGINHLQKSTAVIGLDRCDEPLPTSCGEKSENLKRPNSRQNTGSRGSQDSFDSTPTSKRLKTLTEDDIDGAGSSSNEENFSERSHITSFEDSRSIVSSIASHEVMLAEDSSQNVSDSQDISSSQSSSITEHEEKSKPAREIEKPPGRHSQSEYPWSALRLRSYVAQLTGRKPTFEQSLSLALEQLNKLRPGFPVQYSDLEFCLDLAQNSEVFNTLSDDFVLPIQAEEGLKVVADRLFAAYYFQAASNIYSILLVAEENESKFHSETRPRTKLPMLTPRMVAAARSARTVLQCQLVQDVLRKRLSLHENQDVSISELFLVHQFLADCYWKQEKFPDGMNHLAQSWVIAHRLDEVGDSRLTRDHSLLLYLYYKRAFPGLPSSNFLNVADLADTSSRPRRLEAYGATPIGYDDLMVFWVLVRNLAQGEEAACRLDDIPNHHILNCVRGCVAWCGSINEDIEMSPFNRVQYICDAWQERATVLQNRPTWAMVIETDLGISTSEHLHICARMFSSFGGTKGLSAMSDPELVDSYLKLLYNRISASIGPHSTTEGTRDHSSRDSVAQSMTSSNRSSYASFRDFRIVSQSIKQRVGEVPSTEVRGSYGSGSLRRSGYQSYQSQMSHLSDVFERTSIREEDATETSRLAYEASNMVGG